jgi:hypothetical protein
MSYDEFEFSKLSTECVDTALLISALKCPWVKFDCLVPGSRTDYATLYNLQADCLRDLSLVNQVDKVNNNKYIYFAICIAA